LSQKRSIYFDYDQFVIKDEFKATVEAHAKYLQRTRTLRVTLQGNTDERGTREYNIALGQKRADAVKKLMVLLGASEVQIETVSFGKEKPRREGHDETSWAENRRVDIVYVGE
jgi:peptidoglycan-associated lipoprotein